MAKLTIDLSGRSGLTEGYQGDLNDTTPKPHLRYSGKEGEVAEGIYDPLRLQGYMAPANNTFAAMTGTISGQLNAVAYDAINDNLYFSQGTGKPLRMDGLDDTSLTDTIPELTIVANSSTDITIKDLEIYELNEQPTLFYTYANNNLQGGVTLDGGIGLGFLTLDTTRGIFPLSAKVFESGVNDSSETISVSDSEKLAQKFSSSDFSASNLAITGARLRLSTSASGTQTWTLRIGIQTDNAGRPSGSYVTNGYVDVDPNTLSAADHAYYYVQFPANLSIVGTHHLVIEPTVYGDLSGGESVTWIRSDGTGGLYPNGQAQQYAAAAWANADSSTDEAFDFALVSNRARLYVTSNEVSGNTVGGIVSSKTDNTFLQKADNGFLYWFVKNKVHKIDGGFSGGDLGSLTAEVLTFPSYITCVDVVDTSSLMYIGIQATPVSGASDRTFNSDVCGLYIWDRQSQVSNMRNYVPIYGAKEIKRVFVNAEGEIRVITIGEDKFTEIRGIVNGKCVVLKRLGLSAYPRFRDSLDFMNNMAVWQGVDGIIYALGKLPGNNVEGLYKIGDVTGNAAGAFTSGIIFTGHSESSQSRQGIFVSLSDVSSHELYKWYPHGIGTISSVAQVGNIGNVYSPVTYLPTLSTLDHITIYCAPGSQAGSTVVATAKIYTNQGTSVVKTHSITRDQIARGYVAIPVNKAYTSAVQIEIEYSTSQTLGVDDFCPSVAIVEYSPPSSGKQPRR